jgi:hypothetical protein
MPRNSALFATLVILFLVTLANTTIAQPPNYFRWTGGTAIPPTQGNFNQGTPLTLTWGFMALGTPINDSANSGFANANNNLQTRLNQIYGNQNTWLPLFQSVFDRWSSISGLSFQFEPNDDGAAIGGNSFPGGQLGVRADIRIGGKPLDGNSGVLAYNYFPNVGEMIIDTNDNFYNNTTSNSIRLRNVVSHELGHGLGMPHVQSNNSSFLMQPSINLSFDGPQFHDILAAQHMYGDALEKSNGGLGNDTAARATPLGIVTEGNPISIGNSARSFNVAPTATDFISIDSQTDIDFYSFTVTTPGLVEVLLEPLGFTYNITPQNGNGNVPFDTRRRSDLSLALFDTDGATILQLVNDGGLGVDEFLSFDLDSEGTYFLRVTGVNNPDSIALNTQFYGLTISFVPIPEPTAILLFVSAIGVCGWLTRNTRSSTHFAKS